MNFSETTISLRWPRELFVWEAKRILALESDPLFSDMVLWLLEEATHEASLVRQLSGQRAWHRLVESEAAAAKQVLGRILSREDSLIPYETPTYWYQRQRGAMADRTYRSPVQSFGDLIEELRERDYFPEVLPKHCPDNAQSWEADPSEAISRAIQVEVTWPLDESYLSLPDDVFYSVIEYFHDQARRPRTRSTHDFGECGFDYHDHDRLSGEAVYRWRVNGLLEQHGIELRLGKSGSERGRLIRHADLGLDDFAQELIDTAVETDDEKIASNISLYRNRSANIHDRRAAVGQLAGYLEKRRQTFKNVQFTKGDEGALFNIFNNFALRHDNAIQQDDYGDEYLDWIFWTTLAGIRLLKQVDDRGESEPK